MKRTFFFFLIFILIPSIVFSQKNSFSLKTGVSQCMIKKVQNPPYPNIVLGNTGSRIGFNFGTKYTYRAFGFMAIGGEFQYLLKGYGAEFGSDKIFSDHYLSLSPVLSFFPFSKSDKKYLSALSVETGYNINFCLKTEMDLENVTEYEQNLLELGYCLAVTYQPGKAGIQLYYFSAQTPYLKVNNPVPSFVESRYSRVLGFSILYRFFLK